MGGQGMILVRVRDTRLGKLFRSRTRLAGWDRQVPGEYKWVGLMRGNQPSGGGRGGRMCGRARQVPAGG